MKSTPVQPDTPLTITRLTLLIKGLLEGAPTLQDVWVAGEVSNLTRHASGHIYFSLKDEKSQIRAVMFNNNVQFGGDDLGEGMLVNALGSVGVYERRGEYQMYVRRVRPAGLGELYARFERLKKKLEAEGLFAPERKKPLPEFPWKIAVCTSPTGAAVRDVLNVIGRRFPAVEVTVAPALVQGEEAPQSIVAALQDAQRIPEVALILLVRGGGSMEDLWAFNDERVVRAIAACRIPLISGVGHETDFTLADFAADLRAPTPSAAAEIAVPSVDEVRERVAAAARKLERAVAGRVRLLKARVDGLAWRVSPARALDRSRQTRQRIDDMISGAELRLRNRVARDRARVEVLSARMDSLDPRGVLRRGYSLCYDSRTGRLVRSAASVTPGMRVRTSLADGDFESVVDGARPRKSRRAAEPGTGSLFDE